MPDGSLGYLEADGSTWQTIEMPRALSAPEIVESPWWMGIIASGSDLWAPNLDGLWHYADGTWDLIPYGDPDTGAMPEDVFWGLGWGDTGGHEVLHRHDAAGWQRWSLDVEGMLPGWGVRADEYAVAPDGSLWANWTGRGGISRFDGRTWVRYLPRTFVGGMDVAPDGSMWLIARDRQEPGEPPDDSQSLYVITPKAVPASE